MRLEFPNYIADLLEPPEKGPANPRQVYAWGSIGEDELVSDTITGHRYRVEHTRLRPFRAYDGKDVDETVPADYVVESARSQVSDLAELATAAGYIGSGAIPLDAKRLDALGFDREGEPLNEQAEQLLDEYPLCVEATVTFEVVTQTGGPDARFLIECDGPNFPHMGGDGPYGDPNYEIRRVLFRYSWEGSAEVELVGEDRAAVVAFARRVVPELVE